MLRAGPLSGGLGPRVWHREDPPTAENSFHHALFLLDHALQCTGKILLLDRNTLLCTVKNIMFGGKIRISCLNTTRF